MYRIIIVDDEQVVREGMKNHVPWQEHGFELVASCVNGSEAITAVDAHRPDVVLTDICMPFVDGLELTRHITEHYPRTKVVILTGFDEFSYAQKAVKLQAFDFILKPVTSAEVRKILDRLREALDSEHQEREDLAVLRQKLSESMPLLRERFLNRLITHRIRHSELTDRCSFLGIELGANWYTVMDTEPEWDDATLQETDLWQYAVYNVASELFERIPGACTFQNSEGRTLAVIPGASYEECTETAIRSADLLRESVRSWLPVPLTIGVGAAVDQPSFLRESAAGARRALASRSVVGPDRTIAISDLEREGTGWVYDQEEERRWVTAVRTGDRQGVEKRLQVLTCAMKDARISLERARVVFQGFAMALVNAMADGGSEKLMEESPSDILQALAACKDIQGMNSWMTGLGLRVAEGILRRQTDDSASIAFRAEEYIRHHYPDPDLALHTLCRHLLVSSSYFSLLFKQHTGETFVEYLTRVRMEKAQELLRETRLKNYEVAEKIGLSDPHYFSVLFKKSTGFTPSEFRERSVGA